MNKLRQKHCYVYALLASFCPSLFAADIYRAENPDGSFRYASQALDHNYKLYLQEGIHDAPSTASKAHPLAYQHQKNLAPFIERSAKRHGVDARLVHAMIAVESNFNTAALSPKGAMGAMQLMPATAARYGVTRRDDPSQNIEAGVRYLKELLTLHKGNVALALASYNAGEGAVAKYGYRVPPYKETMLYVPAVLMRFHSTRNLSGYPE